MPPATRPSVPGPLCDFRLSSGEPCGKPRRASAHAALGRDHAQPSDNDHDFRPSAPALGLSAPTAAPSLEMALREAEAHAENWKRTAEAAMERAADVEKLAARHAARHRQDTADAARWRAFVGSQRIELFGTAGPTADGYAHFEGAFWTVVLPEDANDSTTEQNRTFLTRYADAAVVANARFAANQTVRDA